MPDTANEIIDILTVGNPDIDQNTCAFYVHNMHPHPTFKNPRIVRQELLEYRVLHERRELVARPLWNYVGSWSLLSQWV